MQRCLGIDGVGHTQAGVRCGVLVDKGRCVSCRRVVSRGTTRAKRARRPYTGAEQARRQGVVGAWVAEHGGLCPGWQRPSHTVPVTDLTADHPHAVGAGGMEGQALTVLCRACNSSKGAHQ